MVIGGCWWLEEEEEMMVGWLECRIWVELVVDFGEEEEDEVLGYVEIGRKEMVEWGREVRWLGGAAVTARAPVVVA